MRVVHQVLWPLVIMVEPLIAAETVDIYRRLEFVARGTRIVAVAFCPGSDRLFSLSFDGDVRACDVCSGEWRRIRRFEDGGHALAVRQNGVMAVATGKGVELWNVATGTSAGKVDAASYNQITKIAFSESEECLVAAGASQFRDAGTGWMYGAVTRWRIGERITKVAESQQPRMIYDCVFGPHGDSVAFGSADGRVVLQEAGNGKVQDVRLDSAVHAVAFSEGGEHLAVGMGDGRIASITVPEMKVKRVFDAHAKGITAVRFLANTKWLASTCTDGSVRVWDWESGARIATLKFAGLPLAMDVSANGYLAVGGADNAGRGIVVVWRIPACAQ